MIQRSGGGAAMRRILTFVPLLLVAGCAMPGTVQRIGVGYNNAVANLTDELALKNIVRAQHGYPLHYTSLSRLSGSITLKVNGSINAQLKDRQPTDTNTTATTRPMSGADATSIVSTVTKTVLSGGNQVMPSVGAEVDTNPTFDVDVEDTTDFTRGMNLSIEPETIEALIDQGYGASELLPLMISRVDFNLKAKSKWYDAEVGATVDTINNDGRSQDGSRLSELLACYKFDLVKQEPTELAPLSRVTSGREKGVTNLSMQDLALLDGTKLDLIGKATDDADKDQYVKIVRPAASKIGQFKWLGSLPGSGCHFVQKVETDHGTDVTVYEPATPPRQTTFVGGNKVAVIASDAVGKPVMTFVDVNISMIIRSPEALIKFIGNCLAPGQAHPEILTCAIDGTTFFELHKGAGANNDIATDYDDGHYFVPAASRVSLRTLALIETLVNLHKSAADKITTTPVRIISQ
jgi:hypothetical protein